MFRNEVVKWANSTWTWAMRVASIGSMRPSTNMLGPRLLLEPNILTMGKPKATIFITNLGLGPSSNPYPLPSGVSPKPISITNLGLVLQLKPKSNAIMGKPKAPLLLTAHFSA